MQNLVCLVYGFWFDILYMKAKNFILVFFGSDLEMGVKKLGFCIYICSTPTSGAQLL